MTVTKRLGEGVPECGGPATEGPATRRADSGVGDSSEVLVRGSA